MFARLFSFFYQFKIISLCLLGLSVVCGQVIGTKSQAKAAAPAGERAFTPVETLIFDTNHMANTSPGQTLVYKFQRVGVLGDNFKDTVSVLVFKGQEAKSRTIELKYFTGKRQRPYPSLGHVTSNPLLTIYFNKDAWALARRIKAKGTANYLRNRIIDALAKAKDIKPVTCNYLGRQVPGKQVEFRPFFEDENKHHLVHYYALTYQITLSEEVPGGVCSISSRVPFPAEAVPDHFMARLKKLGMTSLAAEAEMVNKLPKSETPILLERLDFHKVILTDEATLKKND